MTRCWECHEPLDTSNSDTDEDDFDEEEDDDIIDIDEEDEDYGDLDDEDEDADDDDRDFSSHSQARAQGAPKAHHKKGEDDLLDEDEDVEEEDDDEELEVSSSTVVAYVAQDEVQAGAISQLLSDCGIRNFAITGNDEGEEDEEGVLQVQVMKEDLAAAQRVIEDFTSEFDDFS